MKPFLGFDLTENKNNYQANGAEFLCCTPSEAMMQTLLSSEEKADQTVTKAQLPLFLQIIQWVCGGVGALMFLGIGKGVFSMEEISFQQAYQNAPWAFWVGGCCLAVWAVLKLIGRAKAKTVLESDEGSHHLSRLAATQNSVYAELAVPSTAKDVDILSFCYRMKDDQIKLCERTMQLYSHQNPSFKVFTDKENLYLANLDGKYAFPLSALQTIRTQDKKVRTAGWNKDVPPTKGIYKPYKMTTDQFGCVHSKPHYVLEVMLEGELWGIYFPCYELPVFEELTGLKAQ